MTKLYFTDPATGALVAANRGMWTTDASGTYRPAKNGWVSKADGSYAKVWPYNVSIDSFTGVKGNPSYRYVTLSWKVTNATTIQLFLAGASSPFFTSGASSGSYGLAGTPGGRFTYSLRAIAADNSYVDSAPVTVSLDALPAPVNFRRSSGAYNTSAWAWNAVPGADNYQVVDTLFFNAVKGQVNSPTVAWGEAGLAPSTTYERAVQARLSTATSRLSNKVRYTTPAAPGSAPGTYNFRALYLEAWAPGYQAWRGQSSGAIHGNGDNWGGNNGANVTMMLYDLTAIRALSGRVTRFKIHMRRDSSAGYSSPQTNRFHAHTAAFRPAGDMVPFLGAHADIGALAWGQDALIDLPVAWGQWLIDGFFGMAGIAWGSVQDRYMRGPSLADFADQGHLYLTLG